MIVFHGPNGKIPIDNIGMYSDNTPLVKNERWEEIRRSRKVTVQADSLHTLTVALFLVDSVRWSGGDIKTLILPYLPGARQDRVNPGGDLLFTANSVAEMINMRNFGSVVCVDPHSLVMTSYINRCDQYPLENVYSRLWKGYGGVIAPDRGAKLRAGAAAYILNTETIVARKSRNLSNGHITEYNIDGLESGRHYLVVDDICDGGRTFEMLGEKIREAGAFADLFVTHGIFSRGFKGLHEHYKNVYTTDTLPQHELPGEHTYYRIRILEDMENWA